LGTYLTLNAQESIGQWWLSISKKTGDECKYEGGVTRKNIFEQCGRQFIISALYRAVSRKSKHSSMRLSPSRERGLYEQISRLHIFIRKTPWESDKSGSGLKRSCHSLHAMRRNLAFRADPRSRERRLQNGRRSGNRGTDRVEIPQGWVY